MPYTRNRSPTARMYEIVIIGATILTLLTTTIIYYYVR